MTKKSSSAAAISEEAQRIGARIAEARDRIRLPDGSKMTNKVIADLIGVTVDAVKKMIDGTSATQYAKLRRLAAVLRTSPNDLLGVSDGHDLDEIFAVVETSYQMMDLGEDAARELTKLVREALEAPLTPSGRQDPIRARRILLENAIQRFFGASPRKGPDA